MASLNQDYATAITAWRSIDGAPQGYVAGAAYPFNTTHPAAFVLFWITPDIQQVGASFTARQFLWGNLDDANAAGWGLMLEPDGTGQLTLMARLYTALGPRDVSVLLSDPASGVFVDQLILAELFYDGTRLYITLNGSISVVDDVVHADLYAPSTLPPSLGGEASGASPATNCAIVAAGFTDGPDIDATTVGDVAGAHFQLCRAAADGVAVAVALPSLPWLHAYTASNTPGVAGTIIRTAAGPEIVTTPLAPPSLVDVGTAARPWPLERAGAAALGVEQESQPSWYRAPAFSFGGDVEPDFRVTMGGDLRVTMGGDARITL